MLPSPRTLLPLLLLAGALALPWPGTALAGPGDGPEGFGPDGAFEDSGLPDLEAGSPAHAGARGKTLVADDLPLMPPDGSATRTPLVVRRDLAQMDSLEGGLAIAAPPLGFPGPLEAGLAGRAEGGRVYLTIRDWPGGASKVSVRSGESFDSCALCARFGGGGHKMAAGCNLPVPPLQARELLLQAIDEVWA